MEENGKKFLRQFIYNTKHNVILVDRKISSIKRVADMLEVTPSFVVAILKYERIYD